MTRFRQRLEEQVPVSNTASFHPDTMYRGIAGQTINSLANIKKLFSGLVYKDEDAVRTLCNNIEIIYPKQFWTELKKVIIAWKQVLAIAETIKENENDKDSDALVDKFEDNSGAYNSWQATPMTPSWDVKINRVIVNSTLQRIAAVARQIKVLVAAVGSDPNTKQKLMPALANLSNLFNRNILSKIEKMESDVKSLPDPLLNAPVYKPDASRSPSTFH